MGNYPAFVKQCNLIAQIFCFPQVAQSLNMQSLIILFQEKVRGARKAEGIGYRV